MLHIDRRRFLLHASSTTAGAAALLTGGAVLARQTEQASEQAPDQSPLYPTFPQQPPDLVRQVVGAAHRDFDKVKALVDEHPALCNATWDWGFGDWETPLGAASHVGRPNIAEYLLSKGARPDIFCAAMLGWLDVVKTMISANPSLAQTHGPHGITLLAHAQAGGEQAATVASYLEDLGTADPAQQSLPLTEESRNAYLGAFAIERSLYRFEITVNKQGLLAFKSADGGERTLFRVGEHEFHPTGAQAVRLRFELTGGRAQSLTIQDGSFRVRAGRI
jgi:hypothetical protein